MKKSLATGQRMFFAGEVERSDSVSQPTMKNAVSAFKELGHLESVDGKVALTHPTADTVRAIEAEVAGYLRPEVVR